MYGIPRGCYASDEWTGTFTDDEGRTVTEDCTQYVRASDGEPVGVLVVTVVNGDYVGREFVVYAPENVEG